MYINRDEVVEIIYSPAKLGINSTVKDSLTEKRDRLIRSKHGEGKTSRTLIGTFSHAGRILKVSSLTSCLTQLSIRLNDISIRIRLAKRD